MTNRRYLSIALCLLAAIALLGGCVYNPWNQIPIIPMDPENLLANGDAENNGLGWHFSDPDATVHSASGNPAFAVRHAAFLRQTVNIENPLGTYAVLMAMTATETIAPTGMGIIYGNFVDAVNPQLVVGYLASNSLISTAVLPSQWIPLIDYFLIPPSAGQISVFMENTEVPGVPHDGAWTWFDDVELWIVETEQEAIDLMNRYVADHSP